MEHSCVLQRARRSCRVHFLDARLLILAPALVAAGCHRPASNIPPVSNRPPTPGQLPVSRPSTSGKASTAPPLSGSQPQKLTTGDLAALRPIPAELDRGSPSTREVALTFDAGSNASAVPLLLKTLQDRGVHATFFLTGRFCDQFPRQARAIADAGMELGNHSYSHPHFTHLGSAAIRTELQRAEAAIVRACGRGAKPLFRFPYGDSNARVIRVVTAAGYQPVAWSLDSLDSVGLPKSAAFVARRIDTRIRPGYITLMHVSYPASARALPSILDRLAAIHARQVPVSQLLLASRIKQARVRNQTAGRLLRLARRPAA